MILSKEWFWITTLSLFILVISFLPTFYQYKITPPDKVYLGLHNSVLDFPEFISEINQGQHGRFTQTVQFTTEPQIGTWVHYPNLLIGWLTGPFGIHPVVAYHLFRFIFGFILLLIIYYFTRLFLKDRLSRLTVFTLTIFSGAFPRIILNQGKTSISNLPFLDFYSGLDVLTRWTFIPHGMFKDILFMAALIFLIKFWQDKKIKFFWLAAIVGFFLGPLSPAHSVILWTVLLIILVIVFVTRSIPSAKLTKTIIFYVLLTLPSTIYIFWVFEQFPWNVAKIWEKDLVYGINWKEYILAMGPLFLLSIPVILSGILIFLTKRGKIFSLKYFILILTPVIAVLIIFSPLRKLLGMNDLRFLGIPLQIFWGTMGGTSVILISNWISTKLKKSRPVISILLVFLALLPSVPTYFISWNNQKKSFDPMYYNLYPPKDLYNGFLWLRNNTKIDDIVLSHYPLGNLIPAFAGNTVYIGHLISTYNREQKIREVESFYKTTMSEPEAYKFLKDRGIKYVVWSFDEWAQGGNPGKYKFLKLRFNNPVILIFEIQ